MKTLRNFDLKSEKSGYVVAVAIALLIASVMLAAYYVALRPTPEGYMTIYLLDSQRKAENYPERLTLGVNSTFSIYVDVENHMVNAEGQGIAQDCTVKVKVVQGKNPTFPVPDADAVSVQPFNSTLAYGDTWEETVTVSLDQAGEFMVAFELWVADDTTAEPEYSGNLAVLNVEVNV